MCRKISKNLLELNRLKILKVLSIFYFLPNKSWKLFIQSSKLSSVLLFSVLLGRLSTLFANLAAFLLYNNVSSYVFNASSGICFNIASKYLYMSTVLFVGSIIMLLLYLLISISFIKCAKKLFTVFKSSSISLVVFVFFF